jgi:dipeptidyl aminopeptidase/acylaminoacyl peptidase
MYADLMKTILHVGIALGALALLWAARVAIKSYIGERNDFLRTPSTSLSRHPESTGIAGLREISFSAADGLRIAAWYAPPQNRAAVVLVHGTGADRSHMLVEAQILTAGGFGILALDLPGQGASAGRSSWGVPEREAISAAVTWLTSQPEVDPARIGGLGASMGAYVLMQSAAIDQRLRAVVLEASPSDVIEQLRLLARRWGPISIEPAKWALYRSGMPLDMRPIDVVGKIAPRPVLIIQGELDSLVPVSMAKDLYRAAGDPKELWIVPGAGHVDYARVAMPAYRSHLSEFFRRALLNQGDWTPGVVARSRTK